MWSGFSTGKTIRLITLTCCIHHPFQPFIPISITCYGPLFVITKFQRTHRRFFGNLVPTYVSHMYFSEYTWSFRLPLHMTTSATPSIPVTKCRFTSCLLDPRVLLPLRSACVKGVGVIHCNASSLVMLICASYHIIGSTIIRAMTNNTPFNQQNPGNLNGCHGCPFYCPFLLFYFMFSV